MARRPGGWCLIGTWNTDGILGTVARMSDVLDLPIPFGALRVGASRTMRFEGKDYGSGISFFFVDNDPGMGPGLHRHPYTETWTVIEGEATITIDGRAIVARAGDTAVVAANTWHGFTNTGEGALRILCIHDSPEIIQEFLDEE